MNLFKSRKFILLIIMILFYFIPVSSSNSSEKILKITKFEKKPKIDGKIDDDCWQNLEAVSGFIQFDPINGGAASEETFVWSGYDSENIYFAFLLKDSVPNKIYGELCPRNQYGNNDEITVILDTYNDERTAIMFSLNPKGIQKTKSYSMGLSRIVDIIWRGEACITKDGWTAEITIPFKSLRFKEAKMQTWQVNFKRYIQRLKETDYWTSIRRDEKLLTKSGRLEGLEKIHPNHNIEAFPYIGYRYSKWQKEIDKKFAAGLDLKYGISSNLVLDMTASPDFSEVESDPFIYQLSPYEVQFSDNRPFFQEGNQYFRSIFNMMYSRRINNPKFAIKLTGKQNGFSIGVIEALNNNYEDPDSLFSVIRVKKDIFKNSEVGIYITGFNQSSNWNINNSIDFNLNLSDIYSLSGQAGFSLNKNDTNKNNGMYYFSFARSPDAGVLGKISYECVEPNVNIKTGIISQIDYQATKLLIGYSFRFNSKTVKTINFCFSGNYKTDFSGTPTARNIDVTSSTIFGDNASLWLEYYNGDSKKQIFDIEGNLQWDSSFFNNRGFVLAYDFYSGRLFKEYGLEIDLSRTPIYTDNSYSELTNGKEFKLIGYLSVNPMSNLELSLNLNYINQKMLSDNKKIFSGVTLESSLLYQITKQLYANLHYAGESEYKQYSMDVLLGYDFGNGDLVQLGYKRSIIKNAVRENGYSIFLKISYLFRI